MNGVGNTSIARVMIVLVVTAIIGLGFTGWMAFAHENKKTESHKSSQQANQNFDKRTEEDPSEGGKYLVITEWGVKALLPSSLQGKISYLLGETVVDEQGNSINSARIYIEEDAVINHECNLNQTSLGESIDTAIQYIRSEKTKPFNVSRYRWEFKQDVYQNEAHAFHLNFADQMCINEETDGESIAELRGALENIKPIN